MSDNAELITLTTSSPTKAHVAKAASTRPTPMIAAAACFVVASTFGPPPPDSSRHKIGEILEGATLRATRTPFLILPSVGRFTVDTERGVTSEVPREHSIADITTGLQAIEHVDGAFIAATTDSTLTVAVLAREHGLVDREALMDLEDTLSAVRGLDVVLTVRAHQGRALRSLSGGAELLFDRA